MPKDPRLPPFHTRLLRWFDRHGRKHLPWQQQRSPYRVWVSEIMLQQTQVTTVIPYFERFMTRFPDVASLARAAEDEVLHHWTGLGYYARARNLHKAAEIIQRDLGGVFPTTVEGLSQLPGIGRSTAGAIVALAMQQRAVILDGNVKRVLTRHRCIEGWPDQPRVQQQLWALADNLTPTRRCDDYTQAIMDLGATLCSRSRPTCALCPVQQDCQASLSGRVDQFPNRKPRKALPEKAVTMVLLRDPDGRVLLEKRPPQGIWGGLWSLPELAAEAEPARWLTSLGFDRECGRETWQTLRHSFTHFHLDITPLLLSLQHSHPMVMEPNRWHWYDPWQPTALGLAAPVKSLLEKLRDHQPL